MPPRLHVLGVPRVEWEGRWLDIPLSRPASLLLYLACHKDWALRSKLAFLYRPDVSGKEALGYLRKLVFRARQFAWAEGLEVEEGRLRWRVATDLGGFNEALAESRWEAALELYQGEFLAGLEFSDAPGFEAWLELERGHLRECWREATLAQAARCDEEGAFAGAARLYSDLLQDDPLNEVALRDLMTTLYSAARPEAALKHYRTFAARLQTEYGVQVSASTVALTQHIEQGLRADVPALPSLPRATTKFFGRARELGEIERLLASPEGRLVVLQGFGGMGKTRLALEAAARFGSRFVSVTFVPLEAVEDPEALPAALLQALGVQMLNAPSPFEQLVRRVGQRPLLLVLDAFEHLTAGAPLLLNLLARCPNLRLLMTSRVRLAPPEAWNVHVEGLARADNGDRDGDGGGDDALALFTERARHVQTHFLPEDRVHFRQLCRRTFVRLQRSAEGTACASCRRSSRTQQSC